MILDIIILFKGLNMKIKSYIEAKIEDSVDEQNYHVAMELEISSAMLSHYKTGRTKQPPLELAKRIYILDKIVIWPYAEAACEGLDDES